MKPPNKERPRTSRSPNNSCLLRKGSTVAISTPQILVRVIEVCIDLCQRSFLVARCFTLAQLLNYQTMLQYYAFGLSAVPVQVTCAVILCHRGKVEYVA